MKTYPAWTNAEDFQNLKDAMVEQAFNNIVSDDPVRAENQIAEDSDIVFDYWCKFNQKSKKCLPNEAEALYAELGMKVAELIDRRIGDMADKDADEALG